VGSESVSRPEQATELGQRTRQGVERFLQRGSPPSLLLAHRRWDRGWGPGFLGRRRLRTVRAQGGKLVNADGLCQPWTGRAVLAAVALRLSFTRTYAEKLGGLACWTSAKRQVVGASVYVQEIGTLDDRGQLVLRTQGGVSFHHAAGHRVNAGPLVVGRPQGRRPSTLSGRVRHPVRASRYRRTP